MASRRPTIGSLKMPVDHGRSMRFAAPVVPELAHGTDLDGNDVSTRHQRTEPSSTTPILGVPSRAAEAECSCDAGVATPPARRRRARGVAPPAEGPALGDPARRGRRRARDAATTFDDARATRSNRSSSRWGSSSLAVPLALLLDRLGFFAAIAARIGASRHLHLWAWFFAAGVTTLFNLDAAVVLLTPLYMQIARRHGFDAVAAAFPPVLLASLASSALPVSNLTNLLAAERYDLGATDFATRLGPASLAATVVGYVAYRRAFHLSVVHEAEHLPIDDRATLAGAPVVVFVLVGFTVGDGLGVPGVGGRRDRRRRPRRDDKVGAVANRAGGCRRARRVARHPRRRRRAAPRPRERARPDAPGGDLRIVALAVVAANAINNLPAVLIGLPALGPDPDDRLWSLLLGVNMGPVLIVSGSLAGLLWLDTTRRLGVRVDARRYTSVGLRVGAPALLAADRGAARHQPPGILSG